MDFGEDWKKEMEARPVPTKTKAKRKAKAPQRKTPPQNMYATL
jgi:hypothetical protein